VEFPRSFISKPYSPPTPRSIPSHLATTPQPFFKFGKSGSSPNVINSFILLSAMAAPKKTAFNWTDEMDKKLLVTALELAGAPKDFHAIAETFGEDGPSWNACR
jgi:hypothetical protein